MPTDLLTPTIKRMPKDPVDRLRPHAVADGAARSNASVIRWAVIKLDRLLEGTAKPEGDRATA